MTVPFHSDVLIVGASAAGWATAQSLRHEGFSGSITLLGDEVGRAYNRPPLSKQVLVGEWEVPQAEVFAADEPVQLDIAYRDGTAALALDLDAHRIASADGAASFGTLVIATGARARRLPPTIDPDGTALYLRTRDDVVTLRDRLRHAQRVTVLGSGVLGSEIAAAARKLGCSTTIVGRSGDLTLGTVGARVSARLAELHRQHGVELRLAEQVTAVGMRGDSAITTLATGEELASDLVVAAVGSVANLEWLESSGLAGRHAVRCDADGRCADAVYAVGDVAAWSTRDDDGDLPWGHQLAALQQAQAVARHIATGQPSPSPVPYFWSELYGVRFQAYGTFPDDAELEFTDGDAEADDFVALGMVAGKPLGVVASNMSREFRAARRLVDAARMEASAPESAVIGGNNV
ncbi:MAG TPA: FAD-dependent oxidoreductase [Microbacterium sp.]|nr:FAD-dependent oxidoreductase [Deltaproteobacteria bacterium]HBS76095.1 FAD-dependent oxidoreductase [Microbacterium sp.]|tara:strand:- start:2276 stop:3493 length:1218 start_codon:yes stop_codon:yes gene_type:complete